MITYPRIAGRAGRTVRLNMCFLHNGVKEDPFAIRQIDIYKGFIRPGQLVGQILIPPPDDPLYPFPLINDTGAGQYEALFAIPEDFAVDDVYLDVWNFLPEDPGTAGVDEEGLWLSQKGQFWVLDDVWIVDDELQTKRLGFEPLDKKLRRGEIRTIEVGLHPLPKYDFDYNKFAPAIAQLKPTITVTTTQKELIAGLVDAPCNIGVRQGSHKNSPFVVQCLIDTRLLLRGTYRYRIKIPLSDNSIVVSEEFSFTVQ